MADPDRRPARRDRTAARTARARGSAPAGGRGASRWGVRAGTGHPARDRAVIEADLRGIPAMRARLRTGDRRTDLVFAEMIDRRVDRLLDELLPHLGTA
jgi:hypothetical protein